MKSYLNKNIQVYVLVMLIVMSVVLLGGTSYALIQRTIRGNNTYSMQTGSFLVSFSNNNTLSLSNKLPVYDDVGMSSGDEFTFTVTNTGEYKANYSVRIEETSAEGLGEVIRYAIDYGNGYKLNNIHALANNKYIVQNKSLIVDGSDTYKLRFWLDIDAGESYANKTFSGKVVLEATQEAYKYGTNVIEAIYNQEDKEGLVAIDKNGLLHTSGEIREYRYSGNVNTNYVWFNCNNGYTSGEIHCEKWRIVGSFENTYENGIGTYRMLKIVRNEILTEQKAFNANEGNLGNFKGSSIETVLNNDYYNTLSSSTKELIMKAKWNIGNTINTNTASNSYNSEKGSIVYDNIGLLNVSDYGYASNNNLWTNAMNANTYSLTNNWLFKENSMLLNSESATGTNIYLSNANLTTGTTTTNYGVRPSVYLKPDVSIIAGFGTSDSPYELGIKYPMDYGIKTEIKVQSDSLETVGQLGLTVNTASDGCPVEGQQITKIAGANVDLVCEYSDDDGTSYYFRGASSHNYVKWAGFYWRIIRINGDGNIRMIYAGDADTIDALPNKQEVLANGYDDSTTKYTQIGTNKFNSSYYGNAYVGLMYSDNLPDVYDTVGVVSSESVTITLSTTSSYYYGTGYTINAKSGRMAITTTTSITITADNISTLVGKYMFESQDWTTSYYSPLILVESVDSSALTVTGKQITRKLIDGLDIEEAYDKTHENKKYSTIMGEADSTTTNTLNGWYNNNIKGTEYESQVADSIICNDRSLYKEEYGTKYSSSMLYPDSGIKAYSGTSENSGLGIGTEITGFGPYYRNYPLYKPSLKCENRNDRFTVSNSKGNQALANPIGLISADEVTLAGGRIGNPNNGYYLYSGNEYWTSSPSVVGAGGEADACHMYLTGSLTGGYVNSTRGVRPVVSLDPLRLNIEGSGTWDDPFVFNSK